MIYFLKQEYLCFSVVASEDKNPTMLLPQSSMGKEQDVALYFQSLMAFLTIYYPFSIIVEMVSLIV